MADVFSKKKRSEVMSRIRGRGNKATEIALCGLLRDSGISGWRRHQKLPGTPDFSFVADKVAVFVDGCFWHGCRPCSKGRMPANNADYWTAKIEANKRRDRRASRNLREKGWKVVRVWEHAIERDPARVVTRICRALKK
ncbi:MAG: DNA mismatch endonuclease Vsr [Elusimicrobia bacterium]|nr:DNA mismatch endonuclease Vsr [Elusimicrobiota bacterium]